MVNVENVLKVADAIERHTVPDLGFNMQWEHFVSAHPDWDKSGHHCKTVACIVGWTNTVIGAGEGDVGSSHQAQRHLGLTEEQRGDLFYPMCADDERAHTEFDNVKPSQAAAVLRHLAATGEIDWSIALTKAQSPNA